MFECVLEGLGFGASEGGLAEGAEGLARVFDAELCAGGVVEIEVGEVESAREVGRGGGFARGAESHEERVCGHGWGERTAFGGFRVLALVVQAGLCSMETSPEGVVKCWAMRSAGSAWNSRPAVAVLSGVNGERVPKVECLMVAPRMWALPSLVWSCMAARAFWRSGALPVMRMPVAETSEAVASKGCPSGRSPASMTSLSLRVVGWRVARRRSWWMSLAGSVWESLWL